MRAVFIIALVHFCSAGPVDHEIPRDVSTRVQYPGPGHWAKPPPDSGINLGFVPVRLWVSKRHSNTEKHLPRSAAIAAASTPEEVANAPRLKEVVSSKKISEVYTEEGYEDSAYDHGGYSKNADQKEDYEKFDKGRKREKPDDSESQGSDHYKHEVGRSGVQVSTTIRPNVRRTVMHKTNLVFSVDKHSEGSRPEQLSGGYTFLLNNSRPLNFKIDSNVDKFSSGNDFVLKVRTSKNPTFDLLPSSSLQKLDYVIIHKIQARSDNKETTEQSTGPRPNTGQIVLHRLLNKPISYMGSRKLLNAKTDNEGLQSSLRDNPFLQGFFSLSNNTEKSFSNISSDSMNSHNAHVNKSSSNIYNMSDESTSLPIALLSDVVERDQDPPNIQYEANPSTDSIPSVTGNYIGSHRLSNNTKFVNNPYLLRLDSVTTSSYIVESTPTFPSPVSKEITSSTVGYSGYERAIPINGRESIYTADQDASPLVLPRHVSVTQGKYHKVIGRRQVRSTKESNGQFSESKPIKTSVDSSADKFLSPKYEDKSAKENIDKIEEEKDKEFLSQVSQWRSALINANTEQSNVVDSFKYPFYSSDEKSLHLNSPLKYAMNPKLIPQKRNGGMEFYESMNSVECPEVSPKLDVVPKRKVPGEWNKHPKPELPRLQGLGDKIDCLKAKYFGMDPLDNPLFKEEFVSPVYNEGTLREQKSQNNEGLSKFFGDVLTTIESLKKLGSREVSKISSKENSHSGKKIMDVSTGSSNPNFGNSKAKKKHPRFGGKDLSKNKSVQQSSNSITNSNNDKKIIGITKEDLIKDRNGVKSYYFPTQKAKGNLNPHFTASSSPSQQKKFGISDFLLQPAYEGKLLTLLTSPSQRPVQGRMLPPSLPLHRIPYQTNINFETLSLSSIPLLVYSQPPLPGNIYHDLVYDSANMRQPSVSETQHEEKRHIGLQPHFEGTLYEAHIPVKMPTGMSSISQFPENSYTIFTKVSPGENQKRIQKRSVVDFGIKVDKQNSESVYSNSNVPREIGVFIRGRDSFAIPETYFNTSYNYERKLRTPVTSGIDLAPTSASETLGNNLAAVDKSRYYTSVYYKLPTLSTMRSTDSRRGEPIYEIHSVPSTSTDYSANLQSSYDSNTEEDAMKLESSNIRVSGCKYNDTCYPNFVRQIYESNYPNDTTMKNVLSKNGPIARVDKLHYVSVSNTENIPVSKRLTSLKIGKAVDQIKSSSHWLPPDKVNQILGNFISRHQPTFSSRYNADAATFPPEDIILPTSQESNSRTVTEHSSATNDPETASDSVNPRERKTTKSSGERQFKPLRLIPIRSSAETNVGTTYSTTIASDNTVTVKPRGYRGRSPLRSHTIVDIEATAVTKQSRVATRNNRTETTLNPTSKELMAKQIPRQRHTGRKTTTVTPVKQEINKRDSTNSRRVGSNQEPIHAANISRKAKIKATSTTPSSITNRERRPERLNKAVEHRRVTQEEFYTRTYIPDDEDGHDAEKSASFDVPIKKNTFIVTKEKTVKEEFFPQLSSHPDLAMQAGYTEGDTTNNGHKRMHEGKKLRKDVQNEPGIQFNNQDKLYNGPRRPYHSLRRRSRGRKRQQNLGTGSEYDIFTLDETGAPGPSEITFVIDTATGDGRWVKTEAHAGDSRKSNEKIASNNNTSAKRVRKLHKPQSNKFSLESELKENKKRSFNDRTNASKSNTSRIIPRQYFLDYDEQLQNRKRSELAIHSKNRKEINGETEPVASESGNVLSDGGMETQGDFPLLSVHILEQLFKSVTHPTTVSDTIIDQQVRKIIKDPGERLYYYAPIHPQDEGNNKHN